MKTLEFIELNIYNGRWGIRTMINLNEIIKIEPDKNWTRIFYKNGESDLITNEYNDVQLAIKNES